MDLAVCAGYIQHNPIDRVSRVFAAPIVKPMPAPPWRELPLVMETMKDAPARMRVLFLFSLCSMLRPGENAKLRKSWIEADVLTIPAVEMKKVALIACRSRLSCKRSLTQNRGSLRTRAQISSLQPSRLVSTSARKL